MAAPLDSHGTQTAVINTEHTLFDSSAGGVYTSEVDVSNLAAGDIVEIRVYKMFLTGGSRTVMEMERRAGAQATDDKGVYMDPQQTALSDSGAIRVTLKQTAGTGRNFDWVVEKFL